MSQVIRPEPSLSIAHSSSEEERKKPVDQVARLLDAQSGRRADTTIAQDALEESSGEQPRFRDP